MLSKAQKAQEISEMSAKFDQAKACFLVDYKGMNVEQVTRLRKKLKPVESEMRVIRNRLTRLALIEHPDGQAAFSEHLCGTNAMVFSYGDPSASAKLLSEFAKEVEHLELKVGLMDGQGLDRDQIKYLATLPSLEVLRAQFLGLLQAPASTFVRVLNEVPSGFVRLLKAKHDQG